MRAYSLSHLGDGELMRDLAALVQKNRRNTAELLAHIAEVDERRLYVPAGYPSMYEYCVRELRFSEYATYKRIRAARVAREFPAILEAVAEGRLHLAAVVLLKSHLTSENVNELLDATAHKTKAEIETLLAHRAPKPDVPERIRPVLAPESEQLAPGPVETPPAPVIDRPTVAPTAPAPPVSQPRSRVAPLAPQRFALQVTISGSTRDKLQKARELLSHKLPSGNLDAVLDLALDALIERLEKSRCGATGRPRRPRQIKGKRTVPAHVRREVWARDKGRCTFVSEAGKRCESRKLLEFDHIEPVAREGRSTPSNLRLRCRAHNQLEAEREFGAGFMHAKRRGASATPH